MSSGWAKRRLDRAAHWASTLNFLVGGFGWADGGTLALAGRSTTRLRRVTPISGPTMWARVGRGESDLTAMLHIWKNECYAIPEVREPRWIIDAGANAGYATRWFAERYPMATVVAVEPDPGNVAVLRRNVAHLDNVIVVEAALTATEGSAALIDVDEGPWALRVGEAGAGIGRAIGEVRCVTIESLLEEHGIDRVGLLKIDIEGGELEVYQAASAWIDHVDAIVTELHDRFRPGCTRAFIEATNGFARDASRGENTIALRSPE